MPKAMLNPEKCAPDLCAGGLCAVQKECPTKAIFQMEPSDMPVVDPFRCRGCSKCLVGCPARAFYLIN